MVSTSVLALSGTARAATLAVALALTASPAKTQAASCGTGAKFAGAGLSLKKNVEYIPSWTFEGWFKMENLYDPDIFMWFDVGNIRFRKGAVSGDSLVQGYWDIARWESQAGGSGSLPHKRCTSKHLITSDSWFHLAGAAGAQGASTYKIWINGVELTDCSTFTQDPSGTYYADGIGNHASNVGDSGDTGNTDLGLNDGELFHGSMGELRFWKGMRTTSDIVKYMNDFTVGRDASSKPSSLVALWDFKDADFSDGGKVPDLTANGYDGTWSFKFGAAYCEMVDWNVLESTKASLAPLAKKADASAAAAKAASEAAASAKTLATDASDKIVSEIKKLSDSMQATQSTMQGDVTKNLNAQQQTIDSLSDTVKTLRDEKDTLANAFAEAQQTIKRLADDLDAVKAKLGSAVGKVGGGVLQGSSGDSSNTCGAGGAGCEAIESDNGQLTLMAKRGSVVLETGTCTGVDLCDMYQQLTGVLNAISALGDE